MIDIFVGLNSKQKKEKLETYSKTYEVLSLANESIDKEVLQNYANGVNLFGQKQVIVLSNFIKDNIDIFAKDFLQTLQASQNAFVLFEDSLTSALEKSFQKYATIKKFDNKEIKKAPKVNVFDIANMFARKDKIGAWSFYQVLLNENIAPEEISGILFWKIKTMILNGDKSFGENVLKNQLVSLTDIYHRAHRGELDFALALENFLLTSLSK